VETYSISRSAALTTRAPGCGAWGFDMLTRVSWNPSDKRNNC